ncbi:MAG: UDP-N-acetylglucosamine--N-acetylmuramyl-(pentapeptide) pyrophosphoryl-undecaprenol N-acetylglucosamine transferase [Candidatus Shapirobacteria bacterium]
MRKIVITGGHLTPALAVIEQLQKRGEWQIYFVGRRYAMEGDKTPSIESEVIPKMGIFFEAIDAGRIQRRFTRYTLLALMKVPWGFWQAWRLLEKFKPKVVLSFGGYVSVPVVIAAWLKKIPVITHEQTTVRGLATRVNTLFARKIAISWPRTSKYYPMEKTVITGNPIRKSCFRVNKRLFEDLRFGGERPFVLITGGNQGSHQINQVIEEILPKLLRKANVLHQCGHVEYFGDFKGLDEARKKLPEALKKRYHLRRYLIEGEMGTFLNKADLVVSRAGANIMTELIALGKPVLMIPLPFLREQKNNAQMLTDLGMAEMLSEKEVTPEKVLNMIEKMLANLVFYKKNAITSRKLVRKNAAQQIVELVEKTL